MNLISLCSHRAIVGLQHGDAEILLEALNSMKVENQLTRDSQRKLHRIHTMTRRLTMVLRATESKQQREERLKNE